jgi:acyl-CoA thioesterase I
MSTTALFIGDSITDCCRRTDPSGFLGAGYVRRVAEIAADQGDDLRIVNTGIGGDRVTDLRRRWEEDCLAHSPDILTILVGVNDMWRRYDADMPMTAEQFEADYAAILEQARDRLSLQRLVIMEPFLVPITEEQERWHAEDLDAKIEVARSLAGRFDAVLLRLNELFTDRASADGPMSVIDDGVHPSAGGHELIAQAWWQAVRSS